MTVSELITELRKQPKDAEVFFDDGEDEGALPIDLVEQDTDDEGNVIVCLGEGEEEEGEDDSEGGDVIDVDFQRVAS